MTWEEQLNYQPYRHQYKENDILSLKSFEDLINVNKILISNENNYAFTNVNWYLTEKKREFSSNKRFKVLSCVSWHMGIPFYGLEDIENQFNIIYIGEFYLQNEGEY